MRYLPIVLTASAALALSGAAALAQTSINSISLQARLEGVVAGPINLTVQFYDALSGGAPVGAPIVLSGVAVQNGIVSVPVTVDPSVFNGSTRYMGLSVNGGPELSPRTLVTSVPYALDARSLAGGLVATANGRIGVNGPPITPNVMVVHGPSGGNPILLVQGDQNLPFGETSQQLSISTMGGDRALRLGVNEARGLTSIQGLGPGTPLPIYLNERGGGLVVGAPNTGPAGTVHIAGGAPSLVVDTQFAGVLENQSANFRIYETGATNSGLLINHKVSANRWDAIRVYSGSIPNAVIRLTSDGETITRILTITGGSDVAEPVAITPTAAVDKVTPGMVMVIDREHDGKLVPCSAAYDRAVAGVLSGANGLKPGMVLSAEGQPHASAGDDTMPLAMTGRVWVLCDANHGPIRRGDSLTTSATAGHAMVASDDARASRAVIGKAMTELASGTGMVMVLVNLQ